MSARLQPGQCGYCSGFCDDQCDGARSGRRVLDALGAKPCRTPDVTLCHCVDPIPIEKCLSCQERQR